MPDHMPPGYGFVNPALTQIATQLAHGTIHVKN
jgi:hypothetical protein